jgi:hypothetical protein
VDTQIISRCGYRCDLCPAYESNIKSDQDKEAMCAAWNKYMGIAIKPEQIQPCAGCQATEETPDKECPVRPCATERGVENCAHCPDYGCEKLVTRMSFVDQVVRDPSSIPQADYDRFIKPFRGEDNLKAIRESLAN